MLTKLNKKHETIMDGVKDEWINGFFSLEFDERKAKRMYCWLYKLSGLKKPKVVVLDSPLAIQYAANILNTNQVMNQVESQVRNQVRNQVESQVRNQVRNQVESQVENQVRNQVRNQVGSQELVFYDLGYEGTSWWMSYWSFYDFFSRIGIANNKDLNIYLHLLKCNVFMSIQLDGMVLVSRMPDFLNRDEQHRLHCVNDYAIHFKDGYGLHFVHGVFFDDELFGKAFIKKIMTPKEIISHRNAEQKAVLIQHYGYENILNKIEGVQVLDEYNGKSSVDGKPVVYQVLEFPITDNAIARVVKVEDHSTHKITVLGVPREKMTQTCNGAIAWTFGFDAVKYCPVKES